MRHAHLRRGVRTVGRACAGPTVRAIAIGHAILGDSNHPTRGARGTLVVVSLFADTAIAHAAAARIGYAVGIRPTRSHV